MKQTIILVGDRQRAFAKSCIDLAPARSVVTIRESTRSSEQNDKMWAMLSDIASAKPDGRNWTPETWKAAFMQVLGHQVRFCAGIDGTGPFPLGFRSSRLSVKEMADLISCIDEYGTRHKIKWSYRDHE